MQSEPAETRNVSPKRLGGLSRQYAQPQLDELMALEEQLAQLRREWEREQREAKSGTAAGEVARDGRQDRAAGAGRSTDRRSACEKWPRRGRLASHKLRVAVSAGRDRARLPQGFGSLAELADFEHTPELAKALQMKIQEAILAGAMQDADEPVPPEFRGLVDEYYRALSDDLSP
jgi:hypothetical protein